MNMRMERFGEQHPELQPQTEIKQNKPTPELPLSARNGTMSHDGIRYNLGREYGSRPIVLEKIDDKTSAIVEQRKNGSGTIVGTFNRFYRGSSQIKERKTNTGIFWDAGKTVADPQPFSERTLRTQRPDETDEAHEERMVALDDYLRYHHMRNDLAANAGFRVDALNPATAEILMRRPELYANNRAEFLSIAKTYGPTGFEIIVTLSPHGEINQEALHALQSIPEKIREQSFENLRGMLQEKNAFELLIHVATENGIADPEEQTHHREISEDHLKRALAQSAAPHSDFYITQNRTALKMHTAAFLAQAYGSVEEAQRAVAQLSATRDKAFDTSLKELLAILNPPPEDSVIDDLRELYHQIKFEEYEVNKEMQQTDETVLNRVLQETKATSAIDLGAGTGRLTKPVAEQGIHVTAVDYMPRHAEIIRHDVPEAEVKIIDWTDTKLPGEKTDVVYCLGRSILHEYTPDRQQMLFREVSRLLRPGGMFLFDIPDRIKGQYSELVHAYKDTMTARDLPYREGTIFDSPDGEHFFTRYVYGEEDIRLLAEEVGFELVDIEETELKGGTGDLNRYFILRKMGEGLHEELKMAA